MGVPQLKNWCCFFPLRTGTIFIVWFDLLLGSLSTIYASIYVVYLTVLILTGSPDKTEATLENERVGFIVSWILGAARIIFSLVLLKNISKNNINFFIPWIVLSLVVLVLECIGVFIIILGGYSYYSGDYSILAVIIFLCIRFYFILVVYSDYREDKERKMTQVRPV